jgi:predicted restriction endonuclease
VNQKRSKGEIHVIDNQMIVLTGDSFINKQMLNSSTSKRKIDKAIKDRAILVAKLLTLDQTDGFRPAMVRYEQALLRSILFFNKQECNCAICGRSYHINFLVTAHIKKRSLCNQEERQNLDVVMPACVFGCDALFERGVLAINENGYVIATNAKPLGEDVDKYIQSCLGKKSGHFNENSKPFFLSHQMQHLEKVT